MPAVPRHRQPIVNAAVTLFRQQGYAGTGLNDIVDSSGAPKGSLYHYFPAGKASIAVAAVEEAGRRVAETLTRLAAETRSTADLLRAHARLLSGWMRQSGFRDGCPMTTVLLELGAEGPQRRRSRPQGLCRADRHHQGQTDRRWLFDCPRRASRHPVCLRAAGRPDPGARRAQRHADRDGGGRTCANA